MVIATQPVDTSTYPGIDTSTYPGAPSGAPFPNDEMLGAMLDAHRQTAFNLAYRLVRRPEDAADAVQDAFVLAVRATRGNTATPRDADHFRPWLLKIVANVALGQLRRKRSDTASSLDELTFEPADPKGEQPLAAVMQRERRGDVLNALLVLPDDQRIALTLREYQELSYDEIGRMLGLDRTATTALIYRARCAFRRAYQGLMARSAPIGCPDLAPLMSAMLDEELNTSTWKDVEQHVAGCRGCRFELRQLRGARRLHATIPMLAPPAGWSWTATLEAARAAGGISAASLASGAVTLGPAGASLGGLLPSLGGLLTGRIGGAALLIGVNLGIMVGAPAHQTAPLPLVQADGAQSAIVRQAAPVVPALAIAGMEGDDPAGGAQPAASTASASPSDPAVATGPVAVADPAASAPAVSNFAAPPAPAPAETARQAAPILSAAPADNAVASGASGADSASPVAQSPDPEASTTAPQPAASAPAPSAPSTVPGAGPAAGAGTGETVAGTVGTVVDEIAGLPQGSVDIPPLDVPPIDVPPIDPPAIDLPPIDVPAVDLPPVDLPAVQVPPVDVPPVNVPPISLPVAGVPPVDLPAVDVPAVQVPAIDVPAVDLPAVDVPAVDVPAVDVAAVDLPAVDLPAVDLPALEAAQDGGKTGSGLLDIHADGGNAAGDGGAARVDVNVNAPTLLTESGASTLVEASTGVTSAAVEVGSASLAVHPEAGNGTGNSASVNAGGPESSGGSISVNVDNSANNGSTDSSNSFNVSVSVDTGSSSGGGGGGGGNDGGSPSVSVSFDSSSSNGGGGNDGNSGGGGDGGININVGGINISLP